MKFSAAIAVLAAATGVAAFAPSPTYSRQGTSLFASNGLLKKQTGQSSLDPAVLSRYNELPFPDDKVLAEYVWVDADGNCRSKTRTLAKSKVCWIALLLHPLLTNGDSFLTSLLCSRSSTHTGCLGRVSSQVEL